MTDKERKQRKIKDIEYMILDLRREFKVNATTKGIFQSFTAGLEYLKRTTDMG